VLAMATAMAARILGAMRDMFSSYVRCNAQ